VVALKQPEHSLVRFGDHSYRWIDVKRFPSDHTGDDRAALEALLNSLSRHLPPPRLARV
jgi:hypothetical protein